MVGKATRRNQPPPDTPDPIEEGAPDVEDENQEEPDANDDAPADDPPLDDLPPADPTRDAPPRAPSDEEEAMKMLGRVIGDAIAKAIADRPASVAPDPTRYPKAKNPSAYNGRNRKGLRTWIGENEICFRTAPNLYRTDVAKVMFAGSFLEGDAKSWFTDYFKDPANVPAFMDDWTLFTIELHRNFGLEDEIGAAEEDLRRLQMSDKDHATYFTGRFRAVSSNLQGTWDDRNLRNQYYAKIAPRLRAQFVSSGTPVPVTLEPLITITERFDRAYWADFELNRSLNTTTSSNASREKSKTGSADATNTAVAKPGAKATAKSPGTKSANTQRGQQRNTDHLTTEGKLTDEEKQRRLKAGLCLYCGAEDHFAKDCTKKVAKAAASSVATEATSGGSGASAVPSARASYVVNEDESSDSGKE